MRVSMLKSAVLAPLLGAVVYGHTTFTTLYVDGASQGDGTCIRMNRNPSNTTFPIEPLSSKDIVCGYGGEQGVARVCPAKEGSTLTFEFRAWPDGSKHEAIDPSHKGPCAVYMKKVDNPTASNNAAGDGWFKIWESTYDEAAGKWCTEKMIDNNGHISVKVPGGIQGGYYFVRPELLALHSAQDNPPDPQFYVGCAQIFLDSAGTAQPPTVSIGEGTYDLSIPGMTYNIYARPLALPYPMYGPPVYTPGVSPSATSTSTAVPATSSSASAETQEPVNSGSASSGSEGSPGNVCKVANIAKTTKRNALVQTEGLKPAGCVLERDNWCAFEVPDYNTEMGCWASSKACWDQSATCWNIESPVAYSHCTVWDNKCHAIDNNCRSGTWIGPPNKGMVLTPPPSPLAGSMEVFSRDLPRKHEVRRREMRREVVVSK